ncbi:MAG TPA: hypothetical protein VGE55_02000 [Limnobacter sp.]|uniref:hypothetical protein n=1 Tax=Limnobacter sp. TaxID=2003368 RepID=UPI002ED84092
MSSLPHIGHTPLPTARGPVHNPPPTVAPGPHPTLQTHLAAMVDYADRHLPMGKARSDCLEALRRYGQRHARRGDEHPPSPIEATAQNALGEFVEALGNPDLGQHHKTSALLNLAQGLGVCKEGECLNILESTRMLKGSAAGLKMRWQQAVHQLVEQQLLALVRHEGSIHRSASLAKQLEIHDVQTLKNHLAAEWGLPVHQDRHASAAFCQQAGNMARALLQRTVTPQAVARNLSEQLVAILTTALGSELHTGIPSSALKGDTVQRLLQTEFGDDVDLHALLEFNDDYSTVRLKPDAQIEAHLLELGKQQELLASLPGQDGTQPPVALTFDEALQHVEHLRGEWPTPAQRYSAALYSLGKHWGLPPLVAATANPADDPMKRHHRDRARLTWT